MRKSTIYPVLIMVLLFFTACEDVIQLDIEESTPVLVVDAWLTDEVRQQVIELQLSQSYFDNSTPPPITDAEVVLTRNDGETFEFVHSTMGQYVWNPGQELSLGTVNDEFELSIHWNNTVYEATTTMPRVPVIDSIGQEFRENELFGDDGIYAQFYARDFPGHNDAYWIKTYKNGDYLNKSQEMNLAYDAGFDAGTGIDGLVFIPPIRELINPLDDDLLVIPYEPGDTVTVEIYSLTVGAFNFLEITRDQINNGDNGIFALPLANTRTNISDLTGNQKALGYFNVSALSRLETVIE